MAGLTKEQRAQRAAEKLAAELAAKNNSEQQEQQEHGAQLVAMFTDFPAFPGAPPPQMCILTKWKTGRRQAGA